MHAMAEPALEIRGLSKRFGALKAVDDVSLTLQRGEIHALIGPNGAGKSTLVAQVAWQMRPDAGTILLGGRDVSRLSVAARARMGLGRTFQVSSLALEFSALRNVMLAVQGRSGAFGFWRPVTRNVRIVAPARAMLERFDLGSRAHVTAAALSHGERRQLELAMAFALEPRVLLLDEPMAGMGAGGAPALIQVLQQMRSENRNGLAMLLIEHDMDAVFRLADRISVLAEGRVIFSGTAAEVRGSALVREVYLGGEG
jgi:branched-chain amino acid transport system ATP-binding protein